MVFASTPPLPVIQTALVTDDPSSIPVGQRMRAAYYLRQYYDTEPTARASVIATLTTALAQPSHGSLLRHEYAYVLGQLQDMTAAPALEAVLSNTDDCVMVRHEAAEALGAIHAGRSVLEAIVNENNEKNPKELVETCRLSLSVMDWRDDPSTEKEQPVGCACMLQAYSSVDPAPAHPGHESLETNTLGNMLRDTSLDLFERYRALFSLRNRGGKEAIAELCQALPRTNDDDALLRHEVAYVLGQLQDSSSITALAASLADTDEHFMVRHESAEALGAIDDSRAHTILEGYLNDENVVVRESCAVALDAAEYWAGEGQEEVPLEEDLPGVDAGFAVLKATRDAHFNMQQSQTCGNSTKA